MHYTVFCPLAQTHQCTESEIFLHTKTMQYPLPTETLVVTLSNLSEMPIVIYIIRTIIQLQEGQLVNISIPITLSTYMNITEGKNYW